MLAVLTGTAAATGRLRVVRLPLRTAAAAVAAVDAWLLLELAAAAWSPRRASAASAAGRPRRRLAVLIPARDEEASIAGAVAALRAQDYPAELVDVIVVADRCRDRTAERALAAGARVLRRERAAPGDAKGAALQWGMRRLAAEVVEPDAIVVVDADCVASPNLLGALEARLAAGAAAAQADYRVGNPSASWAAALRYAGFALVNAVRPRGRVALGLSAGLLGTGMAFDRALLERHPWHPGALIEDADLHLRLVRDGVRVAYAPEAWVSSAMPTSLGASATQQARWEAGRGPLLRAHALPLLRDGVRRRDPVRLAAAWELAVPPQSLLLAAHAALALASLGAEWRARAAAAAGLGAQVAFVAGGLALVRAPAPVWRALARAPLLAVWKLGLLGRVARSPAAPAWVRTARE